MIIRVNIEVLLRAVDAVDVISFIFHNFKYPISSPISEGEIKWKEFK